MDHCPGRTSSTPRPVLEWRERTEGGRRWREQTERTNNRGWIRESSAGTWRSRHRPRLHEHNGRIRCGGPTATAMIALLRSAVHRGVTFSTPPRSTDHTSTRNWSAKRSHRTSATSRSRPSSPMHVDPDTHRPTGGCSAPTRSRLRPEGSLRRLGVERLDRNYQHRISPDQPDRRVRRCRPGSHQRREGRTLRPSPRQPKQRSVVRPRGPAGHRSTKRVLVMVAAPWRRACSPHAPNSASASCRSGPLGKGFLTGAIDSSNTFAADDLRARIPRFAEDKRKQNLALLDEVRTVASAPLALHSRRSRSPGCSHVTSRSCPFQERPKKTASRRIWAPPRLSSASASLLP